MSNRINLYKNTSKTANKCRDQRLFMQEKLRKMHRLENLEKYRIFAAPSETVAINTDEYNGMNILEETFHAIKQNPQLLMDLINELGNAVSKIDAKTDTFIKYGILPILVECLTYDSNPHIQYKAIYALANIAGGPSEQTNAVAKSGAVPLFIRLLGLLYPNVCEIAAWALGNIIGDSSELRDYAIDCGVISPLLNLISSDTSIYTLRTVSWVIANLCKYKDSPPSKSTISDLLPTLRYLVTFDDADVLFDVLWALAYLSHSGNDIIEMLIEADFVRCVMPLMLSDISKLQWIALEVICNISGGTVEQTQHILDNDVLFCFSQLLNQPGNRINCKAMWILSNITAGTEAQIQAVIDHGLIHLVVKHFINGDLETKKEAVRVVTNFSYGGSREQIAYLVEVGVIHPLCQMLSVNDASTTENVLESLRNIIKAARENSGIIYQYIDECGGLDMITKFEQHENFQISLLACETMENYNK